jgi:hypothetical protein
LRDLAHAFTAHDPEDDVLAFVTKVMSELTERVDAAPRRDRMALMQRRPEGTIMGGLGFEDRAVGGTSNRPASSSRFAMKATRSSATSCSGPRSKARPDARTAGSSRPRSTTSPAS